MSDQDYQPYRAQLLTKAELGTLNQLTPSRALASIAWLWLQIAIAWIAAASLQHWWSTLLAALFVGNRYYSLFIIGHDGLHRRLHANKSINDWINDVLILGPIGAITRVNRLNHMNHHTTLAHSDDPDRYKYASRRKYSTMGFLLSFTGLGFVWRAVRNVFLGGERRSRAATERYSLRDLAILVGWQLTLIAVLTAAFGWWGYFCLWWIPVYALTYSTDIARVFFEHSTGEDELNPLAERLVTYRSNWFERTLLAPMNMNHHVAHHLWPSIPFYHLPRATELLYSRLNSLPRDVPRPQMRGSYLAYLRSYCRSLQNERPLHAP